MVAESGTFNVFVIDKKVPDLTKNGVDDELHGSAKGEILVIEDTFLPDREMGWLC